VSGDPGAGEIYAQQLHWEVCETVATLTLTRPERKNALPFQSYGKLVNIFHALRTRSDVKVVIVTGGGTDFCVGGDVHEIIGPLVEMQQKKSPEGLLKFTRMTGEVVKAMRSCPQVIIAAIDGVCAGAGAILAIGQFRLPARTEGKNGSVRPPGTRFPGLQPARSAIWALGRSYAFATRDESLFAHRAPCSEVDLGHNRRRGNRAPKRSG